MKKRIKSKKYTKGIIIDIVIILVIFVLSVLYTQVSGTVVEELSYYTGEVNALIYIVVLIVCSLPKFCGYLAVYLGIRYTVKKV